MCDAGVQTVGPVQRTRDGHEATFAVNHLAHFAIAMRLVPVLAPGARVVFVGSGHRARPRAQLAVRLAWHDPLAAAA